MLIVQLLLLKEAKVALTIESTRMLFMQSATIEILLGVSIKLLFFVSVSSLEFGVLTRSFQQHSFLLTPSVCSSNNSMA